MKALLFLVILLSSHAASLGNIKLPTLGGMQFWNDVQVVRGHKIQQHVWTKHCRLLDEDNWRLAWGDLASCRALMPKVTPDLEPLILLIHGMGRSHFSMMNLRKKLRSKGYEAECISYSSMLSQRETFAKNLGQIVQRSPHQQIYIVTHSLGGIVLRDFSQSYETKKVVGALTLAAPHQGSAVVDTLAKVHCHHFLGPTGRTLLSKDLSLQKLELTFPVETVSGVAESFPYLPFGLFLGKESDGIVKDKTTRLKGVKHYQINASHTFIMNHEKVLDLIEGALLND